MLLLHICFNSTTLIKTNDLPKKSHIHELFFSHLLYNGSRLVAGLRIVNSVSPVDFLEMRK